MEINNNKLVFNIKDNKINGIITDNKEVIVNLLKKEDRVSVIKEDFEYNYFDNTIYEYMNSEIERKNLVLKDKYKKINDSLKIVGLSKIDINRNIITLSESEKKLVQIAIALLSNPDIIVFEEPFIKLDLKNQKRIIMFFGRIKEKFNKTIIFITNDSNILYKYADYILIIKKDKVILEGTKIILENVESLNKNKIKVPEIVEFTYKAKSKYNVKIDYHNDIRDIIKDIYKHV
ncbi:MAG: ATP-binding cassette domain-containing protein [Bacilli bacterium]|nr:ATP-binding cassette domain-containing protein [Bacilli bacterium]